MTDRERGRTSSGDLVPQGLPQGSRQQIAATRRLAGVPSASRDLPDPQGTLPLGDAVARVGQIAPDAAVRPVRPDLDVLLDFSPDQFPRFAQPDTGIVSRGAPPSSLTDRIDAASRRSNNRYFQAVAQRMRVRQERGA